MKAEGSSNHSCCVFVLADQTLVPLVRDVSYSRGNADAPLSKAGEEDSADRSSDHDGLVITLGPPVRESGRRVRP